MSLALFCFCCFLHGVWWSKHCSPREKASKDRRLVQHHKIRTSVHRGAWHMHVCGQTHTHTYPQSEREPATRLLSGLFLQGQRAPPHCLTSPLGNSSGWAKPLYLFTGYLEHLLNPNSIAEVYSPLNCDQPEFKAQTCSKQYMPSHPTSIFWADLTIQEPPSSRRQHCFKFFRDTVAQQLQLPSAAVISDKHSENQSLKGFIWETAENAQPFYPIGWKRHWSGLEMKGNFSRTSC